MSQRAERGQLILVKRWGQQAADRPKDYRARERAIAQQRAEGVFQESLGPARSRAGGAVPAIADAVQPQV